MSSRWEHQIDPALEEILTDLAGDPQSTLLRVPVPEVTSSATHTSARAASARSAPRPERQPRSPRTAATGVSTSRLHTTSHDNRLGGRFASGNWKSETEAHSSTTTPRAGVSAPAAR